MKHKGLLIRWLLLIPPVLRENGRNLLLESLNSEDNIVKIVIGMPIIASVTPAILNFLDNHGCASVPILHGF